MEKSVSFKDGIFTDGKEKVNFDSDIKEMNLPNGKYQITIVIEKI